MAPLLGGTVHRGGERMTVRVRPPRLPRTPRSKAKNKERKRVKKICVARSDTDGQCKNHPHGEGDETYRNQGCDTADYHLGRRKRYNGSY